MQPSARSCQAKRRWRGDVAKHFCGWSEFLYKRHLAASQKRGRMPRVHYRQSRLPHPPRTSTKRASVDACAQPGDNFVAFRSLIPLVNLVCQSNPPANRQSSSGLCSRVCLLCPQKRHDRWHRFPLVPTTRSGCAFWQKKRGEAPSRPTSNKKSTTTSVSDTIFQFCNRGRVSPCALLQVLVIDVRRVQLNYFAAASARGLAFRTWIVTGAEH
jgi:hypothetical protein